MILLEELTAMAKTNIRIIGKKGSKTCGIIVKEAGILRYTGKKNKADVLVNFGLAGKKMEAFLKRFPSAKRIPTINRYCGYSKLNVVNRVKAKGIKVPESKLTLSGKDNKKEWIEKRFSSIGGKGIQAARQKGRMAKKYYQKFISDRHYELRVHTFLWMDDCRVQKRLGDPKEITWNYKTGGHFVTVHSPTSYQIFKEAIEVSRTALETLGMAFGAVDFVVDKEYNLYFLEVNSAPGVSGLSDQIYIDAFKKLKDLSLKEVLRYARK